MHILHIALKNDVNLLKDYIALDEELDVMSYSDFKTLFSRCNLEVSKIVYDLYNTSDECHAAAIPYLPDLNVKRLVNIENIHKDDLKTIITSGLAKFSTYHIIDDIPIEYVSLISPDIVDQDELVFILPLSSREEIVEILNRNPSLSELFGPYLSCTVSSPDNITILREYKRIIEVGDYLSESTSLDDQEDTPLEIYLKTGENAQDIVPEYEDIVYLETLQDIERIHALGDIVYNKLDISLDMDPSLIPESHLKLINAFDTISRNIGRVDLKNAMRWFKYIDNAEVEGFLNYSSEFVLDKDDVETLLLIWSKYHDNVQLNKIILTLTNDIVRVLQPVIPHGYLRYL